MKKQKLFCQTCVIGGISIEGNRAPWAIPLATPLHPLDIYKSLQVNVKNITIKLILTNQTFH